MVSAQLNQTDSQAGVEESMRGCHAGRKTSIVIATQEDEPRIGWIPMRRNPQCFEPRGDRYCRVSLPLLRSDGNGHFRRRA